MHYEVLVGDCLEELGKLPSQSCNCCVTSPPYYGLRDYGVEGQIGLEKTPAEYVERIVSVFRAVHRVLHDDGTLWLNLGDSYASTPTGAETQHSALEGGKRTQIEGGKRQNKVVAGLKPKDLIGIPWMVAFALRADGWYLRCDIIWSKPNPMPESVQDRPTKAHEYLFLLSKSERYYYDHEAIKEPATYGDDDRKGRSKENYKRMPEEYVNIMRPRSDKQRGHSRRHTGFNDRWDAMSKEEQCSGTRNKRSVWTVATKPYPEAHFATFPPELIQPCILAGCPQGGTVLDPFVGSGTTLWMANALCCNAIGIDLNPANLPLIRRRMVNETLDF